MSLSQIDSNEVLGKGSHLSTLWFTASKVTSLMTTEDGKTPHHPMKFAMLKSLLR